MRSTAAALPSYGETSLCGVQKVESRRCRGAKCSNSAADLQMDETQEHHNPGLRIAAMQRRMTTMQRRLSMMHRRFKQYNSECNNTASSSLFLHVDIHLACGMDKSKTHTVIPFFKSLFLFPQQL